MNIRMLVILDHAGLQLGAYAYTDEDDAMDALVTAVGETFGAPLAEGEWGAVIAEAQANEGFTMSDGMGNGNTWYLRTANIPYGELARAYRKLQSYPGG